MTDLAEAQTFLVKAQEDILDAAATSSAMNDPLFARAVVSIRDALMALRQLEGR